MRKLGVGVFTGLLAGCSKPAPSRSTVPTTSPEPAVAIHVRSGEDLAHGMQAALACTELRRHQAADCRLAKRLGFSTEQACVDEFQRMLADADNPTGAIVAACLEGKTCQDFSDCVSARMATAKVPPLPDRACRDGGSGIVRYSAEDWAARPAALMSRFSDHPSSKATPFETCRLQGQQDFILGLRCDDGTTPLSTREQVVAARIGNVGTGGRCGAFIDHYQVRCPEQTYDLFIDMYACPAR